MEIKFITIYTINLPHFSPLQEASVLQYLCCKINTDMAENQGNVSNLFVMDNFLSIKAREELGETDEIREESILAIQKWIEDEEKPYPLGIPLKLSKILMVFH